MIRSYLYDYSDTYIHVKGNITVPNTPDAPALIKKIFKNCATFTYCISELNNTQVDDAEGIVVVMPMYNLTKYCDIYLKTTATLWQYIEMNKP